MLVDHDDARERGRLSVQRDTGLQTISRMNESMLIIHLHDLRGRGSWEVEKEIERESGRDRTSTASDGKIFTARCLNLQTFFIL